MTFYGVVEADPSVPFMLGHPILGAAVAEDGSLYLGPLTGDLSDLAEGHISSSVNGVKDFISKLHLAMSPEVPPHEYKLTVCTHKTACEKALEHYKEDTLVVDSIGGGSIEFDMTLIKNKLAEVCAEA